MAMTSIESVVEAAMPFIVEQCGDGFAALWRAAMLGRDGRGWRWVRGGELTMTPTADATGLWVDYAFEAAEASDASFHIYTLISLSLTEDERAMV